MSFFYIVAVLGLMLSLLAHASTFFGINPQAVCPAVWLLHVGIFVVFIPTILVGRNICGKENREDFWRLTTRNAPSWMKRICMVFGAYAIFNFLFIIFVLNKGGGPDEIDGKKVLHDRGQIIKELTEEEFQRHQAYVVRTFSGHWMVFYAGSMTVLYSYLAQRNSNKSRHPTKTAGGSGG